MRESHSQGAVADGARHALRCRGADVARGEDARPDRLEQLGLPVVERPLVLSLARSGVVATPDVAGLVEFGPQLDEVVQQTAAVPLEQFAAQLMTRYFTTEYLLASQITSMIDVDTISSDLLPDNSGERLGEPIPDAFFVLQDLVTEALQLLQTAGLVMKRSYKVRQDHAPAGGSPALSPRSGTEPQRGSAVIGRHGGSSMRRSTDAHWLASLEPFGAGM